MTAGAGLIETVRVRSGVAPLWSLHRARLTRSARELGIPLPDVPQPEGGEDRVVRLLAQRGGVTVSERPVGPTSPLTLIISSEVHPRYPLKTSDRRAFDRALAEAQAASADDGILLDASGHVAEAGLWTLVWWEGGRLTAPPLALGILDSVARARIERIAGPIAERRVEPAALVDLPLAAANGARGVVPVAWLEGRAVPESPHFSELATRFWP